MAETLLLSLTLLQDTEADSWDPEALDAFIAWVVADLNEIEAVRAAPARSDAMPPGSKGPGLWLLGALTAEVHGENALLLVLRTVLNALEQLGVPLKLPLKLGLSRQGAAAAEQAPQSDASTSSVLKAKWLIKRPDGEERSLELEGSARDLQALGSLLTQAGASLQGWDGSPLS